MSFCSCFFLLQKVIGNKFYEYPKIRNLIYSRSRYPREYGKTVPPLQVLSFCSAVSRAGRNRLCMRVGTDSACS